MEDFKDLFVSLQPGAIVTVSLHPQEEEPTMVATVCSVLLRVEREKGFIQLYFSQFSGNEPLSKPDNSNPFVWDESRKTLIDCYGDVPFWYKEEWSVERTGGERAVEEYRRVPRLKHLNCNPEELKAKISEYCSSAEGLELSRKISAILGNGEAGDTLTQVALVLQTCGIVVSPKNIMAVSVMVGAIAGERLVKLVREAMVSVPVQRGESSETPSGGKQTFH